MTMRKHAKIKVHGKVQGVRFRWSAKEIARHMGLAGFVKNMSDGTVYIEAEGDEEALGEFIDWCQIGPLLADVSHVDVRIIDVLRGYVSFESVHKKQENTEALYFIESRYLL